jgi:hypothetical protein
MLSAHQFKQADIHFQISYVNNKGVCLNVCIHRGNVKVALYALDTFYVEVYYDVECNMINQVKCFTSLKKLEPYLGQINIDEITSLLKAS